MIQVNIRSFNYKLVLSSLVVHDILKLSRTEMTTNCSPDLSEYNSNTKVMNEFKPSSKVKNMKTLDRAAFTQDFTVPCIQFNREDVKIEKLKPLVKNLMLKIPNLKSVCLEDKAKIFLKPTKEETWDVISDELKEKFNSLNICKDNFVESSICLKYDNWNYIDVLRAILPDHLPIPRSFSRVGHIIHLNLRDEVLEYKAIIGQILLDKNANIKTIVNKTNIIDNTFRNFSMELICGENNMITEVKENGVTYAFDFSKVYWNPRLSTEHGRVVSEVKPNDVLFDVFCGVGPFAIPCAKKKCLVYANDLNPDSVFWLKHNVKLNKIKEDTIKIFNKDGAEFITSDIKEKMLLLTKESDRKVFVTMNLPAAALEFVKYFKDLFKPDEITEKELLRILPNIHVYFFAFGTDYNIAGPEEFEKQTGLKFDGEKMNLQFVRNVAPNKEMVKISFVPPLEYLFSSDGEPVAKKACIY